MARTIGDDLTFEPNTILDESTFYCDLRKYHTTLMLESRTTEGNEKYIYLHGHDHLQK